MSERKRSNTSIIRKVQNTDFSMLSEQPMDVAFSLGRNHLAKFLKSAEIWGMSESFFVSAMLVGALKMHQEEEYPILSDNDTFVDIPFTPSLKKAYQIYDYEMRNWLHYFYQKENLGNPYQNKTAVKNGNVFLVPSKMTNRKIEEYLLPKHSFLEFSELNRTEDELIERFFNTLFMGVFYRENKNEIDIPSKMSVSTFSKYEQDFLENKSVSEKTLRIYITKNSLPIINFMGDKFCNCGRVMGNVEILEKIVFICLSYELDSFRDYILGNCYIKLHRLFSPKPSFVKTIKLGSDEDIEDDDSSSFSNIEKKEFQDKPEKTISDKLEDKIYEIEGVAYKINSDYISGENLIPKRYGKTSYYSKYTDVVLFIKNGFYEDLKKSLKRYNEKNHLDISLLQYVSLLCKNFDKKGTIFHNEKPSETLIKLPYVLNVLPSEESMDIEESKVKKYLNIQPFVNNELSELINRYGKENITDIALENLYNLVVPDEDKKLYYYYGSFDKSINQNTRHSALAIPLVRNLFSKYIIIEPEDEPNLDASIVRFALYLLSVMYKEFVNE